MTTLQENVHSVSMRRVVGRFTLSIRSVSRLLTDLFILSRSEVRWVLSGPSVLTRLMMPIKKAPLLLTRRKSLLPKLSTADSASASDSSAAQAAVSLEATQFPAACDDLWCR